MILDTENGERILRNMRRRLPSTIPIIEGKNDSAPVRPSVESGTFRLADKLLRTVSHSGNPVPLLSFTACLEFFQHSIERGHKVRPVNSEFAK
jgi:hypothetical protein